MRWYVGDKKYTQLTIGTADDIVAEGTFGFDAAVIAGRFDGCATPSRDNQILDDEVVRQVVQAAAIFDEDGEIGHLVLVRFSQIQRLKVRDLQPDRSRLKMPKSRKGRHKQDGYYPVQVGADLIEALRKGGDWTSHCCATGDINRSACANDRQRAEHTVVQTTGRFNGSGF
ncbi:MAG: hypothetical protein V4475_02395 [Pseudomonadota bacterium]